MRLQVLQMVPDDVADACWTVYERAFDGLRERAAQRHLMYRQEFDGVLADPRVSKLAVLDDDGGHERPRVAAMATLTNDLDAMPLVSPEFFRARWPELYAQRLVWYVGFLAIDPDYRRTSASALLVEAVCREPALAGGVVGVDICDFNEQTLRLSRGLLRLGRAVSTQTTLHRLDAQTFWAYEFPAAGREIVVLPDEGNAARVPQAASPASEEDGAIRVPAARTVHLDSNSSTLTAAPQNQP